MSLAIDIDRVEAVLLADGWHRVLDGSFSIDAYEYGMETTHWPRFTVLYHATEPRSCAGFAFKEKSPLGVTWTKGPIEAILAVREADKTMLADREADRLNAAESRF